MTTVPDRSTFESAYAGQAPWDIGKPQKPFIEVTDQITGSFVDAGLWHRGYGALPRRAGVNRHRHRLSRSADSAGASQGCRASRTLQLGK